MSKQKSRKRVKKSNTKPITLITIGAGILVVVTAAILIIISSPVDTSNKGVPMYVSTSIYSYINFESNNEYVKALLSYVNCTNGLCVIMFGSKGCPHCHVMYEFFAGNTMYRDICRVLWLESDEKAYKLFYNLSQIEISNGIDARIAGSVPHMVIAKNNFIYAVVVGEVKDQSFWDKLLSSA